jgi:hypothetical protein
MSLGIIFMLLILILLLGSLPTWPHSRTWGYYPSGGFGIVLLVVVALVLLNRF